MGIVAPEGLTPELVSPLGSMLLVAFSSLFASSWKSRRDPHPISAALLSSSSASVCDPCQKEKQNWSMIFHYGTFLHLQCQNGRIGGGSPEL